jgi:hypothetical protein
MAYRTSRGVNDLVLLDKLSNEEILNCLASHYGNNSKHSPQGNNCQQ